MYFPVVDQKRAEEAGNSQTGSMSRLQSQGSVIRYLASPDPNGIRNPRDGILEGFDRLKGLLFIYWWILPLSSSIENMTFVMVEFRFTITLLV